VEYTIKSCKPDYQVFEAAAAEPMDEPDEQALYGWLRNRGLSALEAFTVIGKADSQGQTTVELPEISS
jgi:hypothetical protein